MMIMMMIMMMRGGSGGVFPSMPPKVGFAFVSLAEVGLGRHRDSAANEHAASSPAAPDGRAAPP
eukprot:12426810-Karenia_brevis.AAC.1